MESPQQNAPASESVAALRPLLSFLLRDRRTIIGIIVFLILPLSIVLYSLIKSESNTNVPVVEGPSESWKTLLAFAEREATRIDKDALLSSMIYASPPNLMHSASYTNTLELFFSYSTPSGGEIGIRFQDSSPTSTLRISSREGENVGIRQAIHEQTEWAQNARIVADVQLAPREAVERTWTEAMDYAHRQGISNPDISLVLDIWTPDSKELVWRVQYGMRDPKQPTPDYSKKPVDIRSGLNVEFWVDARNGAIIEREFQDRRSGASTRTPVPISITALAPLTQTRFLKIADTWNGLTYLAPVEAIYNLERGRDGFTGRADFEVGGNEKSSLIKQYNASADITIPEVVAQRFLNMLAESQAQEGIPNYTEQCCDNYPSLSIELQLEGSKIVFHSASLQVEGSRWGSVFKGGSRVPWGLEFTGQTYVINSARPAEAYALLNPYLKKEVLEKLIEASGENPLNK
jgi:hypothetical protein